MFDSLMMAFQSAETSRRILGTNTLNDYCVWWFFIHQSFLMFIQPTSNTRGTLRAKVNGCCKCSQITRTYYYYGIIWISRSP
jgi:hypothetical protein